MFCKSSNLQPAHLEEAQLIKCFANHQTFVQHSNHLLKLRHNGIKLLLLQKCSTSSSWIEQAWRSTSRNNPDTWYYKCSVSSTIFSTCICFVHPKRPAKNYETPYTLVLLEKLLEKATRKPGKGTISRLLLQKVIYGMLPLLSTMHGPFQ